MAVRALVITAALLAALRVVPVAAAQEVDGTPVQVSVGEAKGPVGQPVEILARLTIKDGFEFIEPLPRGNRVIELSSADQGVSFARRVFRGRLEDNAITFKLGVTPTKAGAHPINGVFRVSYVVHTDTEHRLMHVSLPLISTVVGTE